MNAEFFSAIEDLEKEKGIPKEYMYEKIKQAMQAAFRRDNPECADNVEILLDESRKRIEMYVNKIAVDIPRVFDALGDDLFRYLVEGYASGSVVRQVQQLLEMPRYGLALAVRVGRKIDGGGAFRVLFKL